jgi:voltage-gated potassium channel
LTVRVHRFAGRKTEAVAGDVESGLLKHAKTPEDAAALKKFDAAMALPLILAAVLPLVLIPGHPDSVLVAVVVIISWLVFLVDFVVHQRRIDHYLKLRWGQFDLLVVVLTAPWFLVMPDQSKFVMLVRLARLARVVMASSGARRLFERLGRVALVAAIVVFFGSVIAYNAEHATNPEYKTFGDSLWWGIVTLTTVGYGDIVPETTPGRAAGVMIMLTGIAVLGLLAGSLASFFRLDHATETSTPSVVPEGDAVRVQLTELQAQVAALSDQIASLNKPEAEPPA